MALSFITRLLTVVLGYAYPAYECYKTLKRNTTRMEDLRFWCQYWILLALLKVADSAVSWLPMYGEAKLAFVIYLWHPKTMGVRHVHDGYLRPFLSRNEAAIDRALLELRARAREATESRLQAAVSLARAWAIEAAGRVSSQAQAAGGPAGHGQAP